MWLMFVVSAYFKCLWRFRFMMWSSAYLLFYKWQTHASPFHASLVFDKLTLRQCYLLVLIKCTFNGSKLYVSHFLFDFFPSSSYFFWLQRQFDHVGGAAAFDFSTNWNECAFWSNGIYNVDIGRLNEGQYTQHYVHSVPVHNATEYLSNSLTIRLGTIQNKYV